MPPTASAPTTTPSRWRVRRPAGPAQTLASGTGTGGDRWSLQVRRSARGVRTQLNITTPAGRACQPIAVASLPLQLGRVISVFGGRDPLGPAWLVLRLSAEVEAVHVQLSDGTRHDLGLVAAGDRGPARVAVLVYPRHLDVHRIDPFGAGGRCLDDVR